jgi:hypothetical protein
MRGHRAIVFMLVALGCLTAASSTWAHARTTATVYRPFSSSGKVLMSGPTKSGYCFSGSTSSPRRDAWRCFIGHFIYDPCFSSPLVPGLVLCPTAPWRNAGVKLHLTKPLPTAFANHGAPSLHDQPWELRLYDGRKCRFGSGATAFVDGQRLNYFCTTGGPRGLWGYPHRKTQPWWIYSAPYTATHLSAHATIRHAWM